MHLKALCKGPVLPCGKRRLLTKTLLIMKFTAILLLATALQVSAKSYSQQVTLSLKDAPLEQVFSAIRQQTGYSFVYNDRLMKNTRPVSLEVNKASLEDVLQACFKDQPVTYSILDKIIVVKPREPIKADEAPALPAPPVPIKGLVYNETGPLKGASVVSKKTHNGTSTDVNGNFSLAGIPDSDTLLVSFIGYEEKAVPVKQTLNGMLYIVLKVTVNTLDEAQVIAYGTSTRRYSVGSVATITSKDIAMQHIMNPLEALAGRVAGLQVISPSGAPGGMVLTQIRGQNTLRSNPLGVYLPLSDFNQPLYIIDGVPFAGQNKNLAGSILSLSTGLNAGPGGNNPYGGMSPLNSINPLDIESITVLKDADATAIYGSRGANGVILINTKKAKAGKSTVNLSVNTGPTTAARHVPMMNTQQYLQMRKEALKNDGRTPSIAIGRIDYDLLLFDSTKNTDWYHELLGKTAQNTDVHLSLAGGANALSYNIGAGYTKSTFNYPGNFSDQRYTLNSNFRIQSSDNKLTLDLGSMISYDDNRNSSGVSSFGLVNLPPNFPDLLDSAGNLLWVYKGQSYATLSNARSQNYYAGLRQPYRSQNYLLNESLHFTYSLLKGLNLEGTAGYSRLQANAYGAIPIASQQPVAGTLYGSARFQTMVRDAVDIEPQLSYGHTFGRARISVMVGGTYQKNVNTTQLIFGNNYTNDALLNSLAGASAVSVASTSVTDKYVALFGRANMIWNNRYIVNLTGNINGSSLFGPDYRFGNFGSVGAGWIFSETKWIKKTTPWLSYGKISANYGLTGSNGVQPYQYQPNWTASGSVTTYQGSMIYTPANLSSPDFHWASKHDCNGQLSLGFFQNWLLIELSGYLNWTDDQLLASQLPFQTGFTNVVENAAYTLQNSGWEITMSSGHSSLVGSNRNRFTWFAPSFNMGRNYNKITKVDPNAVYANVYRKGQSSSASAFVNYIGVDPTTGLFQFLKADGKTITTTPNTYSPALVNGGDATQMVDFMPAMNFGFGDGFSWKGITVNFHGTFVKQKGFSYLNSVYNLAAPGAANTNVPALILGQQWQNPGDHATLQRFTSNAAGTYFALSTGAVTDASYLRIDNLNIGYQVPTRWIRRLGMTNCSINISCRNLLTITPYELGDPATQNIYSIPPQRVFSGGVNLTF